MSDAETAETRDDAPAATSKRDDAVARSGLPNDAGADALTASAVTINRPRAELFAFWRDFTNLPRFMDNIVRIDPIDRQRSHWVVKAPAGRTVEWDAIVTEERDGAYFVWKSAEGADVPNSGRVEFRDAGARAPWSPRRSSTIRPAARSARSSPSCSNASRRFRRGATCAASSS